MSRRMPSSYVWDEGVVMVPKSCAYLLMREPANQRLLSTVKDSEFRDVLLALARGGLDFERSSSPRGTTQAPEREPTAGSDGWVKVSKAADRLGCSCRAVRLAIERGRLPAVQDEDGRWRIKAADVEIYRAETKG